MLKNIVIFIFSICTVIGLVLFLRFVSRSVPEPSGSDKIHVVTTLFPLYDFVKHIGQDKVEVTLLLPPGVESHAFEPKPQDILTINRADVFVYTGSGMEPWAEDILRGVTNPSLQVVNASRGIITTGLNDPHIWLDFSYAQMMVDTIASGLSEKDPSHADFYRASAVSYNNTLIRLDKNYKTTLSSCRTKTIIYGGHYAFGYLIRRYGLMYLPSIKGFEPDAEPTANDLMELIKQVKKNTIASVFYEELASPKVAETIAKETGAEMLLLSAAHNVTKQDMVNGVSFLSIMEQNLATMKKGLGCS